VKNTLGGGFISGALENWAADTKKSKLNIPSIDTDIYSALLYDPDPSFNLAGVIIGTDKLGHFVDQGFDLFQRFQMSLNKSIDEPMIFSDKLEEEFGPYGLSASGVKSYGDLSANFYGMRFYQNILDGNNPHIKCDEKTGKYFLNNPLNWADYVNESFDEGINCSLFFSFEAPFSKQKMSEFNIKMSPKNFKKRIKRAGGKISFTKNIERGNDMNDKGVTLNKNLKEIYNQVYSLEENKDLKLNNYCPVENDVCEKLSHLNCSNYFVSPQCHKVTTMSSELNCSTPVIERPNLQHSFASYQYPDHSFKTRLPSSSSTTNATKE